MNRVLALLRDRRRAQAGGVLSGVLIITAFIAIIAGALMTSLSTNFLLSRNLVNRVANEATMNSAVEMAIDQLQNSPRQRECLPASAQLNNQTAAVSYQSCTPAVFPVLPQAQAPFATDGTVFNPGTGSYRYVLGDTAGTVYQYQFDQSSPNGSLRWSVPLGGSVSGPPLEVGNTVLVPVTQPTASAGRGCGLVKRCVALLDDNGLQCYMPAGADVITRPAASSTFRGVVYIGDQAGNILAYSSTDGNCAGLGYFRGSGSMLAGPVVLPGTSSNQDHIYVVTFSGGLTRLLHYTASRNMDTGRIGLTAVGPDLVLPWASGTARLAVQTQRAPTRLAISFTSGWLALVQIDAAFAPTRVDKKYMATPLTAAPYWWHSPSGGTDLFGVGGQNGALFVLDAALGLVGTYPAPPGGPAIIGSPTADAAGDWFFGAADGLLYELLPAPALTLAARYGYQTSGVQSAPLFGACPAGSCIYLAKLNGTAYLVPLVDRDVSMTACISTQPPACSGVNPRLWAHVTIGSATNPNSGTSPQTVRMLGFSYYSQ